MRQFKQIRTRISREELRDAVIDSQAKGQVTHELLTFYRGVFDKQQKVMGFFINELCDADDNWQNSVIHLLKCFRQIDPDKNVYSYLYSLIKNDYLYSRERWGRHKQLKNKVRAKLKGESTYRRRRGKGAFDNSKTLDEWKDKPR